MISSTTRSGAAAPSFGIAVLRIDGQIIFYLLKMLAKEREFGGFLVVTQVYVRLEGRFVAEEFVVVGFVGADGDVERGIQIHPRHVAFVVVVREKGVGAQVEELFQRGIVGECRGFAQKAGGAGEIIGILLAIGNGQIDCWVVCCLRENESR